MSLRVEKANLEDMNTSLEMLREAAEWIAEKGSFQWKSWLNPNDKIKGWLEEGFINGEIFFVYNGDDVVAMYRLTNEDKEFWGTNNDNAAYIHNFTTKRNLRGTGLGSKILKHIETELQEKGIDSLRLDCAPNDGLCRFYESQGFVFKGDKEIVGHSNKPYITRLYEKKIQTNN